jgi:hypothetical protein
MKTTSLMFFLLVGVLFAGCVEDGPMGPEGLPGRDGKDGLNGLDAEIYYSPWYSPTGWSGTEGDWYFEVNDPNFDEEIVEYGVILVYMSIPGDLYTTAVRPMPAYAASANWDYLIPDYGRIQFTSDAKLKPGTKDYYFRYVLIPSNIKLKALNTSIDELKSLSYGDVCSKLGIAK